MLGKTIDAHARHDRLCGCLHPPLLANAPGQTNKTAREAETGVIRSEVSGAAAAARQAVSTGPRPPGLGPCFSKIEVSVEVPCWLFWFKVGVDCT